MDVRPIDDLPVKSSQGHPNALFPDNFMAFVLCNIALEIMKTIKNVLTPLIITNYLFPVFTISVCECSRVKSFHLPRSEETGSTKHFRNNFRCTFSLSRMVISHPLQVSSSYPVQQNGSVSYGSESRIASFRDLSLE